VLEKTTKATGAAIPAVPAQLKKFLPANGELSPSLRFAGDAKNGPNTAEWAAGGQHPAAHCHFTCSAVIDGGRDLIEFVSMRMIL
jgi:hypothetical protein